MERILANVVKQPEDEGFFRPNGHVALTVPVSANVYSASHMPQGPIAGFGAVDKEGKRIWRSP